MSSLLEGAMLTAFSVSWYCSIWKMLRTGQANGKSLGFVLLICLGYVCGIASKLIMLDGSQVSPLIYLYSLNLFVTSIDAALVWHLGHPRPGIRKGAA